MDILKMGYSIEPRDRRYVKGYGFLSFPTNIGKSITNNYSQKLVNSAKKSAADTIKIASKRAIQKATEATGDLIGNKIAGKITSASVELHSKNLQGNWIQKKCTQMKLKMKYQKEDIYLHKKDNKLLMN